MTRIKIFISSVQQEFAGERAELNEYILSDPLLGRFFEPFIFELMPATDKNPGVVYFHEVEHSHIYLALLGKEYGFEDAKDVSPTEREFDHATHHHKTRFIFITGHKREERHPKEQQFIEKAQQVLVRKRFNNIAELKAGVYATLVNYLVEKEIIRTTPFDATIQAKATINDLEPEKIRDFVRVARSKRGFPLQETAPVKAVLTHLNLLNRNKINNAAILLFGKAPQRFFINSEIRCVHFYGTEVGKPIPSYKVFKGDVFELVDQAVEFVLSKLDYSVGTRAEHISIPGKYEIPKEVIVEAIVNAIAHRDYTSNASVQAMIFRDRLEIINPGSLPMGWTIEKLKTIHTSVPANPLLAEPMYLKGYIERLGTGTIDMINTAKLYGLKEPEFAQDDIFKTIIYRPVDESKDSSRTSTEQVPNKYRTSTEQVRQLIINIEGERSIKEILEILNLKHRPTLIYDYLKPTLEQGLIEMKYPGNPNHPKQKYLLTQKGLELKKFLLSV